ncbi:cell division protein FtsB [Massilia terrae]|uniref:Cell division protein FtsB n=1 Tax=Massilia terrae TaxID=1811224 RepID=A0ABT2CVL3_9BURK|nr:cell division protein FtsB [Massilia terrae]MCS0658019.1 cell division protein FtsB [Massilia terrae]
MRLITLALFALLLLIQYPLWLGKGGWLAVHEMEAQVDATRKKTDELKARNAKLESEVRDLKNGTGAVEERARYELGMIKQDEIFIQVLKPGSKDAPSMTPHPKPPAEPAGKNAKPLDD